MVVDTVYYDALQVPPNASELDIKKAYRKLAVRLHPDKNPGDEKAHSRFQEIGEAYQILSDPQLRAAYDRDGKDKAQPSSGFEDPAEFFGMVFGGEVFVDWVGELSLMKDLTKTMEMTEKFDRDQAEAEKKAAKEVDSERQTGSLPPAQVGGAASTISDTPPPYSAGSTKDAFPEKTPAGPGAIPASTAATPPTPADANPYSQQRPQGLPIRPALTDRGEEEAQQAAAGMTDGEKELRAKEKKKGLTKEQREELAAYEAERERIRRERVDTLAKKLVDRLSLWTETDKGKDVTDSFRGKMKYEIENLKMESFGIEILHAIGHIYVSKGSNYLKSQNFFGVTGFFGRLKDKGSMVKEVFGTISSAMDAQSSMEEMAKAEEKGGEHWTDEARAEAERRVTGKILAAAWRGSKWEIQSVLREVCDQVLNDKVIKDKKRMERAQALVLMGSLMKEAKRTEEEEKESMVFEQLMAEAAKKKEDKEDKKKKEREKKGKDGSAAGEGDAKAGEADSRTASGEKKHFGFGGSKHAEKEK